jgi:transcription-repair coupling factor (superfamily II helicase)
MTLLAPRLPDSETYLVKWGKLYGASPALAIAEAAAIASGPLIVIAPSSRDAESLSDEIGFFWDGGAAKTFPDLETLPYDGFSAHPDIISARLAVLAELPRARAGVWVVAVDTLLQRLAPRSYIEAFSLRVHVGESLDLDGLRTQLTAAGYAAVTQVVAHGEFAVRGSLLDVFPMGSEFPLRIDMLDRDVDSIRRFDPDTQRSGEQLQRVDLLPARETPLNPDGVREFRRRYRLRFPGDLSEQMIYRDVSQGIASGGVEYFLPLFFERTSHLFEYLPPNSTLIDVNDACASVGALWAGIVQRHEQLRHDRHRPILDPGELYLPPAEFQEQLGAWRQVQLHQFEWPPETGGAVQNFATLAPDRRAHRCARRRAGRGPRRAS